MAGFAARYADTGLVTLAVDVREDEAAVTAFFEDLGVDLPVGLDSDGKASAEWGAIALPGPLLDRRGRDRARRGAGRHRPGRAWPGDCRRSCRGSRSPRSGATDRGQPARSSHASRTRPAANRTSSTARIRIVQR